MPCLPAGVSNEAQFVFTIQSIVMAQKLKGTLSFIAKVWSSFLPNPSPPAPQGMSGIPRNKVPAWKVHPQLFSSQDDEGATHEKLDFRLHFSCSSYLITTPCYRCVPAPHHTVPARRG